jgi:ferritin
MEAALNKQLNAEYYSAYLYLSMSAYCSDIDLPGFAHWMRMQFEEEMIHALKFYDFIDARDGRVKLTEIKAPPVEWKSPLAVFEETYKHEQSVSKMINDLVDLSTEESDHATYNFLQWFVEEQVEEEDSANNILKRIKLIDGAGTGLLIIDQELAGRSASAEETEAE